MATSTTFWKPGTIGPGAFSMLAYFWLIRKFSNASVGTSVDREKSNEVDLAVYARSDSFLTLKQQRERLPIRDFRTRHNKTI